MKNTDVSEEVDYDSFPRRHVLLIFSPDFLDQYDDVLIVVLSYSWYRKKKWYIVNSLAGIGLDTSMH